MWEIVCSKLLSFRVMPFDNERFDFFLMLQRERDWLIGTEFQTKNVGK